MGNSLINGKLGEAIKKAKEKRKSKVDTEKKVSVLDNEKEVIYNLTDEEFDKLIERYKTYRK